MRRWICHRLTSLGPVMYLGGFVTRYWFGLDVRLPKQWLCIHWREGRNERPTRLRVYLSPDATPTVATWRWSMRIPRLRAK